MDNYKEHNYKEQTCFELLRNIVSGPYWWNNGYGRSTYMGTKEEGLSLPRADSGEYTSIAARS